MNDTQQRELYAGDAAKRILDDPLVKDALALIKTQTRELLFELPIEAREQREQLYLLDRMRAQFERVFTLAVQGASISKAELLAEHHAQTRIDAIRSKTYA